MNGTRRLGFAVLGCAVGLVVSAAEPYPLRDAVECTPRGGLPNVLAKLEAGKAVRIAYLGGSITAQGGYRVKTREWFQQQYPKADVSEINAAIGGTGSSLGVYRHRHDVLEHQPDLVFVEFAVNDGGAAPERIHEAMEGIIRQTWKQDPTIDICYVYTFAHAGMLKNLQDGKFPRAASAMEALADHYGIPSIHMGLEAARLEQAGKLVFKGAKPKTDADKAALGDKIVFSGDGVHPYTDTGHQLYLEAVVRSMPAIKAAGKPGAHVLAEAFVAEHLEAACMVPLSRATLSSGWAKLDPATDNLAKRFGQRLPELWKANAPGETITLKFRGTALSVYDLLGPDCGQVIVTVDDGKPAVRARFDAYCTYHRLASLGVANGLPDGVHTVRLEIHPEQIDKLKMLHRREANRAITELDPKKYDDTAWYAGALMLIGELVE